MIEELDKIAHLDNHKKIYATNINQISYNKKEIIKKTWFDKKLNNKLNKIENMNNDSDSDSKDSFYYLTEEESENDN